MRNCLDDSLPVSFGRGAASENVMSPCRSLLPTRPLKSRYSNTAPPALRSLATRWPSVEYGGVSGSVTPVSGYSCAIEPPDSFRRRSSAPRLAGSVKVPVMAALVPPIDTSACTGKGCFGSCSASMPPTLPSPLVGRFLNLPSTFQPKT